MNRICLNVNGRMHEFVVDSKQVLLDILRDDLGLTGAKQGCDRKGQCGACTVIVNNKAVLSCLTRVATLDGASVITVEGLGTPENPHLIQEAYALAGAIQCGYCTPGLIMATKALLDTNLNPNVEEIKGAHRHNLCRCTGYKKIIEAVQLAGRFLRREISPDDLRPKATDGIMGVSHPRPSALPKACGTARFTADIRIKGALEIAVFRSKVPHARIVSIDTSEAEKVPGVVGVLKAQDIRGTNFLKYEVEDRPLLCTNKVRYIGDPIVALVAGTKAQAEAGVAAVKVILEALPVMDSPAAALANEAVQVHEGIQNICYDQESVIGDTVESLQKSTTVVEARFSTQITHMAPLEPEATLAYWEDEDKGEDAKLVVVGRSIDIHKHMAMLQEAVGWDNMRYLEAYSGGHFGIKLEITSEGIAAAAAIHFKRAVRYIPSLAESMLMTSKRHAFDMKVKLGADKEGKLAAYCNDIVVDKGAYISSTSPMARALMSLSGSYYIPSVTGRVRGVYTNNPFGSAARGAGQPQVCFALECAMDMLAQKLRVDPFEFRLQNSLKVGQPRSTGWIVQEWPFPEVLKALRPHYERALKEAAAQRNGRIKRGVGLGAGAHGVGRTGEVAVAAAELDPDGGISIYASAADPGEGNDSMLTQLTAEFMQIPLQKVRLNTRDTDVTPAGGPAAGSRITYMIGGAVLNALERLKAAMQEVGAKTSKDLVAAGKPTRYVGRKKNEDAGPVDSKIGLGSSFVSDIHGAQMVELEVDTISGQVKILKITAAVDAGRVFNPQNLTGQLEGGMDQGVGYALREMYVAGKTKDWVTFKFPTAQQSFEMETIVVQTPRAKGTLGATGVGEMCLLPTAPGVINAINNAIGVWICDLPATPDKIKAALAAKKR